MTGYILQVPESKVELNNISSNVEFICVEVSLKADSRLG